MSGLCGIVSRAPGGAGRATLALDGGVTWAGRAARGAKKVALAYRRARGKRAWALLQLAVWHGQRFPAS